MNILHDEHLRDSDMKNVAQYVLDLNLVQGASEGISKFVLKEGYSKLTKKQKEVFDNFCVNKATVYCEICNQQIPYCELDSDSKLCARCRNNFSDN